LNVAADENAYIRFYFEVMAKGGPADVAAANLPTREAIARLREVGAVPVVAHPNRIPLEALEKMIAAGLVGIEAICSYHDAERTAYWLNAARRFGLLHTAGSDFHGMETKPHVRMGAMTGNDYVLVERLREAIAALK